MYKFAIVRTSGTALDEIGAEKRQMFQSGGLGAAWLLGIKCWGWYLFGGGGGWIIYGTQTFAEEMNCAGGDGGKGIENFRHWGIGV